MATILKHQYFTTTSIRNLIPNFPQSHLVIQDYLFPRNQRRNNMEMMVMLVCEFSPSKPFQMFIRNISTCTNAFSVKSLNSFFLGSGCICSTKSIKFDSVRFRIPPLISPTPRSTGTCNDSMGLCRKGYLTAFFYSLLVLKSHASAFRCRHYSYCFFYSSARFLYLRYSPELQYRKTFF